MGSVRRNGCPPPRLAQFLLEGLRLANITGTGGKGIFLANIRHADIRDVKVTGFTGELLNIVNVTGQGLAGAAKIDLADLPKPSAAPVAKASPYQLH